MDLPLWHRIQELKKKKNAVILAHYYEDGAIQELADFVGDSFQLALYGQKSEARLLLLAGVVFMAESVKILNPRKKVIVPDLEAGCSLVQSSPYADYKKWKESFSQPFLVSYINSSAEVKAISDVIVTSSNAEKIIRRIPENRTILFGPDRNLGRYLVQKTGRAMELWPGTCEVHVQFSAEKLWTMKQQYPDAVVLAHPECDEVVLQLADVIGSTSRLLQEVENNSALTFIVATEPGIFHQMKKKRPDAEILQAPILGETCGCHHCPYMKLNTLEKIERALLAEYPEIFLDETLLDQARKPLERMIEWAT